MADAAGFSDTEAGPSHSSGAAAAAAAAAAEEAAARVSLLDVVIEEYNQHKDARTSRLLLIGELDADKVPLLQKFHADFLDSLDASSASRMTGALFVLNGGVLLQLVEAPTRVLLDLLRNLAHVSGWTQPNVPGGIKSAMGPAAAAAPPGSAAALLSAGAAPPVQQLIPVDARGLPLLRSSKILSFTEEVPREFHVWAFRSLRVPAQEEFMSGPGAHLERDALRLAFDTLRNMLELGRELSALTEEKAIDYVQSSVAKQLLSKLPSQEQLQAFIHAVDDLATVPEWLDIYDTPIDFTLENEKVWPVEPFLKVTSRGRR